jgi:hypothetical protein
MKTEETTTQTTETAAAAAQGAQDAPEKASSKKGASRKKGAPKAKKAASKKTTSAPKKQANTKKKATGTKASKPAAVPREFSKKAIVLDLLRRSKGATMAEIAKATGWQAHSIRGFISGALSKKMGLTIESSKNEAGERSYRITK